MRFGFLCGTRQFPNALRVGTRTATAGSRRPIKNCTVLENYFVHTDFIPQPVRWNATIEFLIGGARQSFSKSISLFLTVIISSRQQWHNSYLSSQAFRKSATWYILSKTWMAAEKGIKKVSCGFASMLTRVRQTLCVCSIWSIMKIVKKWLANLAVI